MDVIELFDQMVRNVTGGEMLAYWAQYPMPAEDFVYARMGSEAKNAIAALRAKRETILSHPPPDDPMRIGHFRLSGEVHQWMYDRYSLGRLLLQAGFHDVSVCPAQQSRIPDFNTYGLDIEPDGSVRKPDSLFMEPHDRYVARFRDRTHRWRHVIEWMRFVLHMAVGMADPEATANQPTQSAKMRN